MRHHTCTVVRQHQATSVCCLELFLLVILLSFLATRFIDVHTCELLKKKTKLRRNGGAGFFVIDGDERCVATSCDKSLKRVSLSPQIIVYRHQSESGRRTFAKMFPCSGTRQPRSAREQTPEPFLPGFAVRFAWLTQPVWDFIYLFCFATGVSRIFSSPC